MRGSCLPQATYVFLLIFIEPKDSWYMPNLKIWGVMLATLNFVSIEYPFLACAVKGHWELNSGPSAFRVDALPTELFSAHDARVFYWQAMVQVQPSGWQHLPTHNMPIFAVFWAPKCSTVGNWLACLELNFVKVTPAYCIILQTL